MQTFLVTVGIHKKINWESRGINLNGSLAEWLRVMLVPSSIPHGVFGGENC